MSAMRSWKKKMLFGEEQDREQKEDKQKKLDFGDKKEEEQEEEKK